VTIDYIDASDASFETDVMTRSAEVPVVVDLWAPWCGPCKTLGPILEQVIQETEGQVALVKINVDENPQASAAFRVQGIPAVYALRDGKVIDGFVGAQGEPQVREFIDRLLPSDAEVEMAELLAAGDEASLRKVLELDPGNEAAIVALGDQLVDDGRTEEALALLDRIPETAATRHVAARARAGTVTNGTDDVGSRLDALLDEVKGDDEARQQFVDLLELLGPEDPRTADYRRKLTARLF
jgi:putative thioredoxin